MSGGEMFSVIEGDPNAPQEQSEPVDPLVGQTIDGRYLVEGLLGQGGMGIVYRCKHTVLNKPLAMKVLRAEVTRDEQILARFRQEAQSASAIGSQHIIDIHDFGTLPDRSTYFVMEFLHGLDLTAALEEQSPMSTDRAIKIGKQLCRALGAAHERGIIHRDLKPDNIFLIDRGGESDFVKVLDFGIAKVGGGTTKLTKAGQVFGTPHYMSPEQCSGSSVDHRTDIYALGVIFYEMCSGRVPFDADNLMGILTKHMYEEPVPPHTLPPPVVEVSPGMEAIILKCLAKQLAQRYQSMGEVLADLEKVESGLTPGAVVEQVDRSSDVSAAPAGRTSALQVDVGSEHSFLSGNRKLPLLAGGAALLLFGIGGLVLALGGGDGSGDTQASQPPPQQAAAPPAPAPVETGSKETAKISIKSEPAAAEVWRGDELIGNTPVEIPRPEKDERLEFQLKKSGYTAQDVRIGSMTAESVLLTLEQQQDPENQESEQADEQDQESGDKARDRATRRARAEERARARAARAAERRARREAERKEQNQQKEQPKRSGWRQNQTSEVVDPWAQ